MRPAFCTITDLLRHIFPKIQDQIYVCLLQLAVGWIAVITSGPPIRR